MVALTQPTGDLARGELGLERGLLVQLGLDVLLVRGDAELDADVLADGRGRDIRPRLLALLEAKLGPVGLALGDLVVDVRGHDRALDLARDLQCVRPAAQETQGQTLTRLPSSLVRYSTVVVTPLASVVDSIFGSAMTGPSARASALRDPARPTHRAPSHRRPSWCCARVSEIVERERRTSSRQPWSRDACVDGQPNSLRAVADFCHAFLLRGWCAALRCKPRRMFKHVKRQRSPGSDGGESTGSEVESDVDDAGSQGSAGASEAGSIPDHIPSADTAAAEPIFVEPDGRRRCVLCPDKALISSEIEAVHLAGQVRLRAGHLG